MTYIHTDGLEMPPMPGDPSQQFGGAGVPPNGIPKFEVVPKRKADGTYDYVEYVDIIVPGDPRNQPRHKVTDAIRDKYRPFYDHWKRTQEMAPQGTPLEMWPVVTPSQVHDLKARNVFTVEQLGGISDSNLDSIPMGLTLRAQAQAWLKEKEKADDVENRRRESQSMQDGMKMMEKQIAALAAELEKAKAEKAAVAEGTGQVGTVYSEPKDAEDIEAKRARMAKAREALAAKRAEQQQ